MLRLALIDVLHIWILNWRYVVKIRLVSNHSFGFIWFLSALTNPENLLLVLKMADTVDYRFDSNFTSFSISTWYTNSRVVYESHHGCSESYRRLLQPLRLIDSNVPIQDSSTKNIVFFIPFTNTCTHVAKFLSFFVLLNLRTPALRRQTWSRDDKFDWRQVST